MGACTRRVSGSVACAFGGMAVPGGVARLRRTAATSRIQVPRGRRGTYDPCGSSRSSNEARPRPPEHPQTRVPARREIWRTPNSARWQPTARPPRAGGIRDAGESKRSCGHTFWLQALPPGDSAPAQRMRRRATRPRLRSIDGRPLALEASGRRHVVRCRARRRVLAASPRSPVPRASWRRPSRRS
jgi:hypothetical protein